MVAGSAVQKFGPQLEDHQQLLLASADILIEIYMAESTILRTEKNAKPLWRRSSKRTNCNGKIYLYHAVDLSTKKPRKELFLLLKVMNKE